MNLIEIVGVASSIATLILFIAYICGKCFIIKQMKDVIFERIDVSYNDQPNNLKIVDEYDVGERNNEQVYMYSSDFIKWIKIFEYNYDKDKKKFNKGKLLETHERLRNGHAIKINTYLTEGIPKYMIEYQRYDFMIGSFPLAHNGKNGILGERIVTKHTIKSIVYYLVR